MENEDVIRQQMEETRTSLAEKVETLEQKLTNTVQETAESVSATVTDTVATVSESVQESVETVKHWFDLRAQVDEHPWTVLGGSMAVGFVLGNLLSQKTPAPQEPPVSRRQHHNGGASRPQQTESSSSWFSAFEPELNRLKGLALGAVLGTVREMIRRELPSEMGDRLKEIVDDVTRKVGGQPISSSDWREPASATEAAAAEQARQEQHDPKTEMAKEGKKKNSSKHQERFKMG